MILAKAGQSMKSPDNEMALPARGFLLSTSIEGRSKQRGDPMGGK